MRRAPPPGTTRPAEGAHQHAPERAAQGLRPPVGELGGHAVLLRPPGLDRGASTRRPRPTRPPAAIGRTVLRGSYPWPLDAERRREPERPAGRGHAARVAHPRPGPVRLLHHAGRLRRAADEHQPDADPVRLDRRRASRSTASRSSRGASGVLVPLKQPLGGLVAPMLDAAGVLPMLAHGGPLLRQLRRRDRRRHGAGDALADARRAGHARRVHAGRRQGVRRRHERDGRLHRR